MKRQRKTQKENKPNFIFVVEPGEPTLEECLVDMAKVLFQLNEMRKRAEGGTSKLQA